MRRSRATWQARILPSQPREPKPPGHEHAVDALEQLGRLVVGHVLGVHPAHADGAAVLEPGVLERFVDGEIGVLELHVLAHQRDLHDLAAAVHPLEQLVPVGQVRLAELEAEPLAHEPVEPLALEHARHLVHVGDVRAGDDRARVDVGEERDLVPDVARELLVRAADDDVGMDADPAQLVHRVLRRLRLQLAGGLDERDERDVDVDDVLGADLAPELADRLEERQRLDVADGAADLGDDDVGRARLGGAADARLDLVRDVRDHLHRRAEEVALALLAQDGVPDRAGAVARAAEEVLVDEALVVADVEVGLGPVLRHEDLAVLERAHRPRVDVEVRVELLELDAEAARLQQTAERGGDDSLPQSRDDAPCHKDVLRGPRAHGISG